MQSQWQKEIPMYNTKINGVFKIMICMPNHQTKTNKSNIVELISKGPWYSIILQIMADLLVLTCFLNYSNTKNAVQTYQPLSFDLHFTVQQSAFIFYKDLFILSSPV